MATKAFVFVACATQIVAASNFLAAQPLTQQDVKDLLLSELTNVDTSAIQGLEDDLRPMFLALPKTEAGTLEASTARYALHRFFVKKHGWIVRGLMGSDGGWDVADESAAIMKDRAPAYIWNLLQERFHNGGLGLHELAVFAATLSNLIHAESAGQFHKVFESLLLPTVGPLETFQAKHALDGYLLTHVLGGEVLAAREYQALWPKMEEIYMGFDDLVMWYEDMMPTFKASQIMQRNPFVKHVETYDDTLQFVQDVGHKFGGYQNLECHKLKSMLVDLEHAGTGRVPLSNFYKGTVKGDWYFAENTDYLRSFGALDESDPSHPSVIIPNYLNGYGNCMISTGFYQVCCVNECEALMAQVEVAVASPNASPEHIARIVTMMPSDTVDAPRNLSTALMSRLDEISRVHDGHIPLHGRLFEQWMHHAYPRECPYPHANQNMNMMSPEDWTKAHGTTEATTDDMKRFVDLVPSNVTDLPWDAVEQLVATRRIRPVKSSGSHTYFFVLAGLAALVSFATPVIRAGVVAGQAAGCLPVSKADNCFV